MSHPSAPDLTYSSALRYGLSPIKSVEEVYSEKIGKYKLVHKVTKLVPEKHYSYNDYLAFFHEDVLKGISTPPKFKDEDVHRYLVGLSLETIKKVGLKNKIDRLEELRESTSMVSSAERHDIIIDITKELATMMSQEEQGRYYVNEFFESSNFALSYFGDLMRGSRIYKRYLNLMEYELRILRNLVRASIKRSTHSAMITHKKRRRELRPIVDACDSYRLASMTLKTYVEICNSEKIEQIFKTESIDANKLDKQEFQRLLSNYTSKLDNLSDKLFERKPELFTTKIDFNKPINNMWRNMILSTV